MWHLQEDGPDGASTMSLEACGLKRKNKENSTDGTLHRLIATVAF